MSLLCSQWLLKRSLADDVRCAYAAFSSSAACHASKRKKKTSDAPTRPRPKFEREGIPHAGKSPAVAPSRARRQFDAIGGSARRSRGPLASPTTVSGDGRRRVGRAEQRPEGRVTGDERGQSPSSFHRSIERASREKYRMQKELGKVRYDNEHEFPSPSSSKGSVRPRDRDTERNDATRDFSEFDRPLKEGAYDEPELQDEFFHPLDYVSPVSGATLKGKHRASSDITVTSFTSPPLKPGFVSSLYEILGRDAKPTPIQALSIQHLVNSRPTAVPGAPGWRQFLLASETGSGKSIAYLLPLLQHIKDAEVRAQNQSEPAPSSKRLYNPRGLVMAPTHELARQLTGFAKGLLRADDVKLRVLCASRANVTNPTARTSSSPYETESPGAARQSHPVDVVVGTPMKLLEMVRGRGFDAISEADALARAEEALERDKRERDGEEEGKRPPKVRRGRDRVVHFGKWKAIPEMGLANVEWVVVDEADVLFDPDFQETTRALLADISAARGATLPASASTLSTLSPVPTSSIPSEQQSETINYPFNLILTSATIPKTLNGYLKRFHPNMLRLASPRLHRLPKTLQTEYVGWTGGNKFADVMRRLRRIWAEDAASANSTTTKVGQDGKTHVELSKILVFCNKSAKVAEFASYLEENGIKSVALTSASEQRLRGSNGHLNGFLREKAGRSGENISKVDDSTDSDDVKKHAHVMVTTSLLSRGLDFAPSIKHVFIVDEPRNTIDFIHRAGRTGRAGQRGKVVIFGKMAGRGSARTKEIRKRVSVLTKA